jgi:hypothetical protein
LKYLVDLCATLRGSVHSFDAVDFLAVEDGGGEPCVVTPDRVAKHFARRLAAERRRNGVRTDVRFDDVPFEDMSTANFVDAVVRPECRAKDASYAAAMGAPMGLPTHFVSHAWGKPFVQLVASLEETFRARSPIDPRN